MDEVLWAPSPQRAASTALARFARDAPTTPEAYDELWRWSTRDLEGFWARVWDECGVDATTPYRSVHGELSMPGTRWFEGAQLSFPAHLLRGPDDAVAVHAAAEGREDVVLTRGELRGLVARAQRTLAGLGVGRGDRVAAVVPNTAETLVLAVATMSLGAVWSSCSPDFGPMGIVDRFRQIEPTVLVVCDGYRYGGRAHPLREKVAAVLDALPDVGAVVVIEILGEGLALGERRRVTYDEAVAGSGAGEPDLPALPFDAPLYVLYSSGTTGAPKSILHGAGGTLVTHLKEHRLHSDVQPGDVVFWFTTCGWMMWNWLISALASEAAVVLYDGSPTAPDVGALWRLAERAGTTHFGTSPRFLSAMEASGQRAADLADLSRVRTVMSTGSPLSPEQFDHVYASVGPDVHLASVSGGTDIVACFAGGVPTLPVRRGRLQGRSLGMAVEAWDDDGRALVGETGELVCTQPFPSAPLGFWGDDGGERYRAAYYERFPGVWHHGDWVEVDPDGSVAILGRSDTTLNPGGVRIGTAELYRAIEPLPEVADAVVVGLPVGGDVEVVLCVVPAEGVALDDALVERIRRTIRAATTPRHVPARVLAVREVPYTISGKKVEKAVLSALRGEPVGNRDALANPHALDEYATLLPR